MKALTIARINVLRLVRDRSNIFFVFVFPLLLVLVIGVTFGGGGFARVAVVLPEQAGPLAEEIAGELAATDGVQTYRLGSEEAAADAVARGDALGAVVVPTGYDDALRSGGEVQLRFVARPDADGAALRAAVDEVAARQGAAVRVASFAADEGGLPFEEALARAPAVLAATDVVDVEVSRAGGESQFAGLGRFDLGAVQQLLLFVFLTSLAGSSALIQTRQWGLSERMLSTPTSARAILVGEALGRFGVALTQALYIVLGTLLVFGVDWGDPLGAALVISLFALASAGAAMLMGATFQNDAQAGGMGVFFGLGLAALGGCMLPLELFSPTMTRVAHVTPHAWALDAFAELTRRDGTVLDVLPELGVLAGFAAVLLALASRRLRAVTVTA